MHQVGVAEVVEATILEDFGTSLEPERREGGMGKD
jgi:hypothetical protein